MKFFKLHVFRQKNIYYDLQNKSGDLTLKSFMEGSLLTVILLQSKHCCQTKLRLQKLKFFNIQEKINLTVKVCD